MTEWTVFVSEKRTTGAQDSLLLEELVLWKCVPWWIYQDKDSKLKRIINQRDFWLKYKTIWEFIVNRCRLSFTGSPSSCGVYPRRWLCGLVCPDMGVWGEGNLILLSTATRHNICFRARVSLTKNHVHGHTQPLKWTGPLTMAGEHSSVQTVLQSWRVHHSLF